MVDSGAHPGALAPVASAEGQPSISFLFVGSDAGAWEPNARTGLERRDLGGRQATAGWLGAWEVRSASPAADSSWQEPVDIFHALVVTAGQVVVEGDGDGEPEVELAVGDVVCVPCGYRYRLRATTDLRLLEVTWPAGDPAGAGMAESLLVHRDAPEAYNVGRSPTASRRFLAYRDIPVPAESGDRIRLEVIRAHIGGHSSGWHFHPMAQIVFPIQGRAFVDVAEQGTKELEAGTAIYLPPSVAHNLREISEDYALFELFIPGIGGTTQCDAPVGWIESSG